MSKDKLNILVSLDEVLDTRLGVLDMIDPVATYELLKGEYFTRDIDDWELLTNGKITNVQFKELYGIRNKEILKRSRLSGMAAYLKNFTHQAELVGTEDPTCGTPNILLNIYPYTDLTDIEQESMRLAVEGTCCSLSTQVSLVNLSMEEITPNYLQNTCEYFFTYEMEKWKDIQRGNLLVSKIPEVFITAPRLFKNKRPDPKDYLVDGETPMSPWSAAELILLEYFHLNMIDIKFFSLLLP